MLGTRNGIRGEGPRPEGMNEEIQRLVNQKTLVTLVAFSTMGGLDRGFSEFVEDRWPATAGHGQSHRGLARTGQDDRFGWFQRR